MFFKESEMKNKSENDENKKGLHSNDISTRRKLLGLAFLGGTALLASVKEKSARADAVGGDTGVLTEISNWLKVTYNTQVAPTLTAVKDGYEVAKVWVDKWNSFVHAYNEAMNLVNDGIKALTTPQENIFYLQAKQMIDYVDKLLSQKGGFLNFRLQYINPVLMQKIDSYLFQAETFAYRAQHLAMLKYFDKKNENEISNEKKKEFFEKHYPSSNIAKATIRVSNDIATYGIQSLRIEALRQTVSALKNEVATYPLYPGKPPLGMAPQKSRGQVFQEVSSVTQVDIGLEQLTLLNEISMKLTNIMMIVSETGHGPIVSEKEGYVSKEMFNQAVSDIKKSANGTENVIFKLSSENKNNKSIKK